MRAAARQFVERCRTPGELADFIPTVASDNSFYAEEAMASSCILADRFDEAGRHLDRLRSIMSKPTYDWERVVLARAERLARTLASDRDEAKQLLRGGRRKRPGPCGWRRPPENRRASVSLRC